MWLTRVRRALLSDREQDALRLREASCQAGATALADVAPRQTVTVQGELRSVTLMPVHQAHWFSAELTDGSGTLNLVWMGRRTVPGIVAGATLTVTGRVGRGPDGRPVMYNPCYELVPTRGEGVD